VLKGFRDFIMRGNVIDLAVGIVIGAAFTAVVNQFTKSFLEPIIKVAGGGGSEGGTFSVRDVIFNYGAFINAVITFLLTAAALYFLVVVPMNKLNEMRKRGEVPEPEVQSDEVILLTEIRDALRKPREGFPPRHPA
jgi:large conductance mechanosensitive channel